MAYPNYDAAMAPIRTNAYSVGQTPRNANEAIAYGTYMVASAVARKQGVERSKQVGDTYASNQFRASGRSLTQILAEAINTIGVDPAIKAAASAEVGSLNGMIGNLQRTTPAAAAPKLADGYYVDAANYYFYVTAAKVLIIGGPGGAINKNINAGTDTYNKIVATLLKEGRQVTAATAQAAGRGPASSTPPAVTTIPAVANAPATTTTTGGSFLDRLTSDPLGAIMSLAMNPWVITGVVVAGGGLLYLAMKKSSSPVKTFANRGKKRRSRRPVEVEVEDEDVDVDEDGEDVEVEEEEAEVKVANKRRRKGHRKARRGGKKAR